MRGWQSHNGGQIPSSVKGAQVMLLLRNGQVRGPARANLYGGWIWRTDKGGSGQFNIVKYRVARKQDF